MVGVNGDGGGGGAILLVLEIVTWTVTCDLSYDVGCELVTCDFGDGGAILVVLVAGCHGALVLVWATMTVT